MNRREFLKVVASTSIALQLGLPVRSKAAVPRPRGWGKTPAKIELRSARYWCEYDWIESTLINDPMTHRIPTFATIHLELSFFGFAALGARPGDLVGAKFFEQFERLDEAAQRMGDAQFMLESITQGDLELRGDVVTELQLVEMRVPELRR